MLFNSYIFVFLFLSLAVAGFWVIRKYLSKRCAYIFLILMSCWFYAYADIRYLPTLFFNIGINYFIYKFLQKQDTTTKARKNILIVGLLFNGGSLCYYKYFNFFRDNINSILGISLKRIILPLGISYIIFQQIAFIVDSYRKETADYSLTEYILFVLYFPKIISGPIMLHEEFFPQLRDEERQKVNWDNVAEGLYIFAIGMGKKVLLADTFGKAVNYAYNFIEEGGVRELYALDLLIVIFSYTVQLYFDFSGYCDMAAGISKMFNIDLPINFNSPYKALSISDFWKRWHITLTRFLTKYIYIPLGGNRKGILRTYLNILIVFLISGLWHGTGWNYLIWGLMHGIFMVLERMFPAFFKKMHPALSWLITFAFVNVAWIFFRADTVGQGINILIQLLRMNFTSLNDTIVNVFNLPEFVGITQKILSVDILRHYKYAFCFAFLGTAFVGILGCSNSNERMNGFKPGIVKVLFTAIIMVWSIFSFAEVSTFLYWEF